MTKYIEKAVTTTEDLEEFSIEYEAFFNGQIKAGYMEHIDTTIDDEYVIHEQYCRVDEPNVSFTITDYSIQKKIYDRLYKI